MVALAESQAGYVPISVSTLVPDRSVGVRLYLRESKDVKPRLYCAENVPFEDQDQRRLLQRGIRTLYISTNDHHRFQAYLRENLDGILQDDTIPVKERFGSLNLVVRDVLSEAFSRKSTDETVDTTHYLAHLCVEFLDRDDCVARELFRVMYHDYHTFTHSANVSYFCVMLAKSAGFHDKQMLHEIAVGGLVHDIGKLDIPDRILLKPGKLDDREFDIIKNHPRDGFLKLSHRTDLSKGQLRMVYQHHERIDGMGYPVGCHGSEIHDWAKICAVVDVFEALTANRPYRKGMPVAAAFEIMDRGVGKAFDEDYLACWKSTINPTQKS